MVGGGSEEKQNPGDLTRLPGFCLWWVDTGLEFRRSKVTINGVSS
jgi:hypothetical protein